MGVLAVERRLECRAGPGELWPLVTDTERLNRAIGLSPVVFSQCEGDGAARYLGKTVLGGLRVEYEERPFEWVAPERFSVRRNFHGGPARSIDLNYELEAIDGGGTRVTIRFSADPRIGFLGPFIRLQLRRNAARVAEMFRRWDVAFGEGEAGGDEPGADELGPPAVNANAVKRALEQLLGVLEEDEERDLAARLARHVEIASDLEASRIRPFELADRWEADRMALLRICLKGVAAGLLELSWGVICPSCRIPSEVVAALSEIREHAGCHLCDLSFDVELDRAVEANFRAAPALRRLDLQTYCWGGPARTPHVVVQRIVLPSSEVELPAPAKPGRYRLFARGGAVSTVEVGEAGPGSAEATLADERLEPRSLQIQPSGSLKVRQTEGSERHLKLEHLEWASTAATAHAVSLLPEFRSVFGSEVLRSGVSLKIARVALLFTDLTDSTALYSRLGDARAYRLIQEHFDALRAVAESESGVIVKTIGDAIMAAFLEDGAALRAAVAMHRGFSEFRQERDDAANVKLKIGVFAGPCYAITANENFDYFGQTVNIAARLQAKAAGGEIVTSEELADEAQRSGWLAGTEVADRFEAELKGVERHLRAARVPVD